MNPIYFEPWRNLKFLFYSMLLSENLQEKQNKKPL